MLRSYSRYLLLLLLFLVLKTSPASAYAILAHEAIVDASWENGIKPLLREKYPMAVDSDMLKAHAYIYGGAMMADMGYLPLGSAYFSDLMHYVRSGELIENLIGEAQNINEYAFALGALSHYLADEYGHSRATNRTIPIIYDNLRKQYGSFVTYGDNPTSHSRVEFSYDVLQIARGNYNTQAYHQFIGFKISRPVLERAFLKTYGEQLSQLFSDFEGSVSTFRWGVKNLMPALVRKTWHAEKESILKRQPGITAQQFKYKMKNREFHQEFGRGESKPGFWAGLLSWLVNKLPKIGPLKTLKYIDPGEQGEKFFVSSFDTILVCYAADLQELHKGSITLENMDFDTGRPTHINEYALADQTYAELMISLEKSKFKYVTPALKEHLLNYYSDPQFIPASAKYPINCDDLTKALQHLQETDIK